MFKLRILALTCIGALAACSGEPAAPQPTGDVGALLVIADVADSTATTAVYTITGEGLADPLTGTMPVVSGLVEGQLQVPVGAHDLTMKIFNGEQLLCEGRADDMVIATGRTSQVTLIPQCGPSAINIDSKGKRNHAPQIHAVFASARTVIFKEKIAISVSASDPDGDDLNYKWTEQVAGLGFTNKFAPATGWQAGPQEVTENKLTITVKDDRGGTTRSRLTIDLKGLATGAGTCDEPSRIRVGDTVRGFTLGNASDHNAVGPECGFDAAADQPEHVFKLRLTTRQDVSISVANSAFNARVYVRRTACADPAAQIACDGFSQRVDLVDAEPGDYYIFVDGADLFAAPFEFRLSVFSGAQPENCANFNDDDGDTLQDCADPDCADAAGCRACVFDCDPVPNDCFGGQCNPFQGVCDTFIRFGESCDSDSDPATDEICGVGQDAGRCVPDTTVCGNAIVENGEQCDDGNQVPADGCDPDCIVRAVCGNGLPEGEEQCDDGNTTDGDGCRADCTVETVCGNGIPEFPEECDDGNSNGGDGCDPSCRVELCGGISCDDGNPCTVNGCDPSTETCTVTNLPDNASCELDGIPETAETCQVGQCVAPPPDPALMILDTAVLADPAFSFRAMQDRMASDGNGAALFEQWATTLTVPTTVENGRVAQARPGFTRFFNSLGRDGTGAVDLAAIDFLPAAMVNRFDLRTAGNCGENRLVFTKVSGASDGANRMTMIFEFVVPDDGSNCRNAIARWTALRDLGGDALRVAAAELLETFAVPGNLNQFRTNEFIDAGLWELREFHLVDGQMVPFPVMDSPPFELGQDPVFRQFVIQNAGALNRGAREIGLIPLSFLDAATQVSGQSIGFGNIVPSLPGLEQNVNVMSCSGCHSTNTGTGFVHIIERTVDGPAQLSQFMRSELDFRGQGLEIFLDSTP